MPPKIKPRLCNRFENRGKRDGGSFDAKTADNGNSISKGFADKNVPYLLTNSKSHCKVRVKNVVVKPLGKPSLSLKDEKRLILQAKKGNLTARQQLLHNFFSLNASLAQKFCRIFPWIEFSELLVEGNFGILKAIENFSFEKNAKFSTYAWFWIAKAMKNYLNERLNLLKIPLHTVENFRKILKVIESDAHDGKDTHLDTLASKTNLSQESIDKILDFRTQLLTPVSLNLFIDGEEHETALQDILSDGEKSVEEQLQTQDETRTLIANLNKLNPQEAQVLRLRFGLEGNEYFNLKDAACALKLSGQQVKDIEYLALKKLKVLMGNEQ